MLSKTRSVSFYRCILYSFLLAGFILGGCDPVEAVPPMARTSQPAPTGSPGANSTASTSSVTGSAAATRPPFLPVPTTPVASSQIKVTPEELKGVSPKFWHIWTGETVGLVDQMVASFNANNTWGIRVKAETAPTLDEMYQKVNQAIEKGSPPALVMAFPYQALEWGDKRPLVDLNIYINDPIWGLTEQEQSGFYPVFWDQDIAAGKRYGVPAQRSGQVLFYNQTWAQQLGFAAPPMTSAELREQACAAAQANRLDADPGNDQTGGILLTTQYTGMLAWLSSFGSSYLRPANNTADSPYSFNNSQTEEAFTFLRSLTDQGCAWITETQPPEVDFAARRGLFSVGSVTEIPYQRDVFQRAGSSDRWMVIPFPSPSEHPAIAVFGSEYILFESTPQEQLAAWLFVKWLLTPENQARLVQNTAVFPLQSSTLDSLNAYRNLYPQWSEAVGLIPMAQPEPAYASWRLVRWALSDATTQLFRYYFTVDKVPDLLKLLDETAAELHTASKRGGD